MPVCIPNTFCLALFVSLSFCSGSILPSVGSSIGSVNGYHTCKGERASLLGVRTVFMFASVYVSMCV